MGGLIRGVLRQKSNSKLGKKGNLNKYVNYFLDGNETQRFIAFSLGRSITNRKSDNHCTKNKVFHSGCFSVNVTKSAGS